MRVYLGPQILKDHVQCGIDDGENTLKKMETESGAKIAIRGKGSVRKARVVLTRLTLATRKRTYTA